MFAKLARFIQNDIWRISVKKLKGPKGLLIRFVRILILSFKEFNKDQCSFRASALTFYSLLSIVPVFAMAFGIAKGFGLDKMLHEKILESAQGQQEVMSRILEFSENFIQSTKGGLVAGIGLALLFWTIIQVLTNIEVSFNHIFAIKTQRTMGRKFTDYLSLMLIAPVFFIMASSATVFMASQVELITKKIAILGVFAPLIFGLMKFLPVAVFGGLLTYLYIFLPNGKIQFKSALLGGLVAGVIYHGVQWAYIHFQIGASNAGAVYGTFAALPLFLGWLQTSWLIVLYGAELAFAHQYEERYEFEQECLSASEEYKKLLTLRVLQLAIQSFAKGETALSSEEIANKLEMPIRLTRELIDRLEKAHLLIRVVGLGDRDARYQPAQDVDRMTIQFALQELDRNGNENVPVQSSVELDRLRDSLRVFQETIQFLPENRLLKDLPESISTRNRI